MRYKLKNMGNGNRYRFTALFQRFEIFMTSDGTKKRALLYNVRCGRKKKTKHLWLNVGKRLDNYDLRQGDKIQFTAIIQVYSKVNHFNKGARQIDWTLNYFEDFIILKKVKRKDKKEN